MLKPLVVPVSLLALLLVAPAQAAPPDIPPYLFLDGSGELRLTWRRALDETGGVELYRGGELVSRVRAVRVGDLWRATLPIACGEGGAAWSYRTEHMAEPSALVRPPCEGERKSVRFSFLTDTQMGYASSRLFAARVASEESAFVLHGGDMVQIGGDEDEWATYLTAMAPFASKVPLVAAAGNHEYILDGRGDNLAKFFAQKGETSWYRFSSGAVDVFVLNSTFTHKRDLMVEQVVWLRRELERARQERPAAWRLVLFHHPPYSQGVAHSPWFWKREYDVMRRYYVPAFEEHAVDLVLSGHTHLFERSFKDGVHYLVGGAAGGIMGWFGGVNPYGTVALKARTYSVFDASAGRLRVTTRDVEGAVLDVLELTREGLSPILSEAPEEIPSPQG